MRLEPPASAPACVEISGLSMRFGGLLALDDVSLALASGQVLAVIGPNGAGKSTLVNCLSGFLEMTGGRIAIEGAPAPRPLAPALLRLGIARTFQNIRLFANLSVAEQVVLAHRNFLACPRAGKAMRGDSRAVAERLLAQVGLAGKSARRPAELSYGERRRLEIARALATMPRLLLLDEPAAGMMPAEQMELAEMIAGIAATGVAVILIEHHMAMVARAAHDVMVLNFGRVLARGSIDAVRADPAVVAAYLGSTGAVPAAVPA